MRENIVMASIEYVMNIEELLTVIIVLAFGLALVILVIFTQENIKFSDKCKDSGGYAVIGEEVRTCIDKRALIEIRDK